MWDSLSHLDDLLVEAGHRALQSGFQITNEKPIIIPTNHNSSKQHDEPIRILAIAYNLLKARENRTHKGFAFH